MALLRMPLLVFAVAATVYVLILGPELSMTPTRDGHFVHLADSYLHGQLHVRGARPPTYNDWARYEGRWYVTFPPFPAVLLLPAVALFGVAVWDRLFWALFAALGPMALWLLLERLRVSGRSTRTVRENLLLTALFGFGSVYFFCAVQGSVWFAAHVVASVLLCLFLLFAIDVRRPLLAGLCLALSFMTRPTTSLLAGIFAIELLRAELVQFGWTGAVADLLRRPRLTRVLRRGALFSAPLLLALVATLWLNYVRFDDPFVYGHEYLTIRWRPRIERYGLFAYHYLGRNLGVFLASLPWTLPDAPYVRVSRHGLALWFTTPLLIMLLWPRREMRWYRAVAVCVGAVALLDLCYQNSGWIQFGYRFALDYLVVLFALLAVGGQRLGKGAMVATLFAFVVNSFGAITFDRMPQFYDNDPSQRVIFQPD